MSERVLVWILGDQLLNEHPAIRAAEETDPAELSIVLIESSGRKRHLPYQRKKLVLLLSAMRHYASRLRDSGYRVDYVSAESFEAGLRDAIAATGATRLFTMAASEYDTRQMQQGLETTFKLSTTVLPNSQFLVEQFTPPSKSAAKRSVMEPFYRSMRRYFGVLVDSGESPVGGEWNMDRQNREPLPANISIPPLPHFAPDDITQKVMEQVERDDHGVGTTEDFALAVTHEQAEQALEHFLRHRLAKFGPYEDAMSAQDGVLFHSLISPYINIGLLEPLPVIRAAEQAYHDGDAPINSVEGFIRQILGWREYIYWQYWQQMPELRTANAWEATRPMPQFLWDGKTNMRCLQHVVERLLATGYTHHIERLMLVCNFCLLAGIDPTEVAEWFLVMYIDAYDWVVLPNVIGMGLNADNGRTATKPYIASANYINKMSDYCGTCRYNPRKRHGEDACPYNALYWDFLIRHEVRLRSNPRMGPNVLSLKHLDDDERSAVRKAARTFLDALTPYGGEDAS